MIQNGRRINPHIPVATFLQIRKTENIRPEINYMKVTVLYENSVIIITKLCKNLIKIVLTTLRRQNKKKTK